MLGEYIQDRWMVRTLKAICAEREISFSSWSDDWVIQLEKDDRRDFVIGYRFGLNDAASANIAQDKVATYEILSARNIPAISHVLVRTKVSAADHASLPSWRPVVLKPLVGTSGHGVRLFPAPDEAMTYVEHSAIQGWALSPFVDIKRELRITLLDEDVLLCYEKRPVMLDGLKMFNLGLGGQPHDIVPEPGIIGMAHQARVALGLHLCSVDIIEDQTGNYKILEVNDAIMMEHYARASADNERRVAEAYRRIVAAIFPA